MAIQGLKVEIHGSLLQRQCMKQLEYHERKLHQYEQEYEQLMLIRGGETAEGYSNSIASTTKSKITEHKNKMEWYRFFIDHLDVNDYFILSESDLVQLGYIERNY